MKIAIDYTPETLALGDKPTFVSATDGDTPTIQAPIRMLGIDTPELHYEGADAEHPDKFDPALASFLAGKGKKLDPGLREHLAPRLDAGACARHIQAGAAAFEHFQRITDERLRRVSASTGRELTPRRLFTMVSNEVFDHYGRLLAYVAPVYTKAERKQIPAAGRPTFNLQLVQDGHATPLLIYPNIPKRADLELMYRAAADAARYGRGLWAAATPVLHAHEFRWIVSMLLGKGRGPSRYCGDFTTGKLYPPQRYHLVPNAARLWFFARDVGAALKMGFELQV